MNTIQVDCDNAGSSFLFAAILGPNNRQGQVPKYSENAPFAKIKIPSIFDDVVAGEAEVFGQPEVPDRFPSENPNNQEKSFFTEKA